MNENGGKSSTILLTVIGIATLLVVVVGATFAYFAAQVTGNDNSTSIQITASQTGSTITFAGGEKIELTNIYPKTTEWVSREISISNTAVAETTSTATYTFYMNVEENTFDAADLQFTFTKDGDTESETKTQLARTAGATQIATGTVNINVVNTIKYTLKVYYVNSTTANQNPGDGSKSASFYVSQTWVESNS